NARIGGGGSTGTGDRSSCRVSPVKSEIEKARVIDRETNPHSPQKISSFPMTLWHCSQRRSPGESSTSISSASSVSASSINESPVTGSSTQRAGVACRTAEFIEAEFIIGRDSEPAPPGEAFGALATDLPHSPQKSAPGGSVVPQCVQFTWAPLTSSR